jgi:hypothetical protein
MHAVQLALPRMPADTLPRVLMTVVDVGARPSHQWLEAYAGGLVCLSVCVCVGLCVDVCSRVRPRFNADTAYAGRVSLQMCANVCMCVRVCVCVCVCA